MTFGDTAFAPLLESMRMSTKVVEEEVLNERTMSLPKAFVLPLRTRSGEMDPLNLNSVELLVTPVCRTVRPTGSSSYHRTMDLVPLATVCWVHRPILLPCPGSTADTAWV